MHITSISLKDFRNYENQTVKFIEGTNVIYGDNAQGKTNLLEAVYIMSQGRGHRAKTDRELVRFGASCAKLKLEFSDSYRDYVIMMVISRTGKKSIKVNQVPIVKLSRLMNYLNVVMFSPEDLDLVKGSPALRRRFLDSAISQMKPAYMNSLMQYHKALAQKNGLLKMLRRKGAYSDPTLSIWNEALAEEGRRIVELRQKFIEDMNGFAGKIQQEISGEKLSIEYVPSVPYSDAESFLEFLTSRERREIEAGQAMYGIQRDDIRIFVNGNDARLFGSQGQQRTCVLSLKIAQADYIFSKKDEYPVLLLDDIMSELDLNRRTYLAEKIRNKQVLLTCTDAETAPSENTKLLHVKKGKIG